MANGETFWPEHSNGNPRNDGELIPLENMSSEQLTSFIDECEEKGVTFVACEWGGPDFQTLANDERVTLLTCIRHPIKRFISNYNYDYYRMWTKVTSYEEYLKEGHLHSSPEYYTKIFARGKLDLDLAKSNLELFDHVIVAEDGMDTLEEFGWHKEKAIQLIQPLVTSIVLCYCSESYVGLGCSTISKKKKFLPPEELKINDLHNLDLELYDSLRR